MSKAVLGTIVYFGPTTLHSAYETYSAQLGVGALSYNHFVKTLDRWASTEKYDKSTCPTCRLHHVLPKYDEHKQSIARQVEEEEISGEMEEKVDAIENSKVAKIENTNADKVDPF